MKRAFFLALLLAAGCNGGPRPGIRGGPATVALLGRTLQVDCLSRDPDRRHPLRFRERLAEDGAVLCGWARDRILHFWNDGDAAVDVAILAADGTIVETHALAAGDEEGMTSKAPARWGLFVREGWLARNRAHIGERVKFGADVAPPEPMPAIKVGGVTIEVEVSQKNWMRMRGLMHRRTMSPDDGMLFAYPYAMSRSFWMGHCHYALDIAYFDKTRKLLNVVTINPYADPKIDTGERAPSDGEAQFVLEMHKGWFLHRGLTDTAGKPARDVLLDVPAALASLIEDAE